MNESFLETVSELRLRRVFGLFLPIFDSLCGGSIRNVDTTPTKGVENRLKRTEKSTEA